MKHSLRLRTRGEFGYTDPPVFVYNLTAEALFDNATRFGVEKYVERGKKDGPAAPTYERQFNATWATKGSWARTQGGAAASLSLVQVNTMYGGRPAGLWFTDPNTDNPHAFAIADALAVNESASFNGMVFEVDKPSSGSDAGADVKGHIFFVRLGGPGQGALFQIRDGRPEIAQLSPTWNRADEDQLRTLWALSEPIADEVDEIEDLTKQLYTSFQSLSFSNSTSRDTWRGEPFAITFLVDPSGVLHMVLEGADVSVIEFSNLTAMTNPTPLWKGNLEVGATGGGWMFLPQQVAFASGSRIRYGPWWQDVWSADLGDLELSAVVAAQKDSAGNQLADVTVSPIYWGETGFGFDVDFTTTDPRYGAWLYGLVARLENGPRTGLEDTEVDFDTDDLPAPPEGVRDDTSPILEGALSMDERGRRCATLTMRDIRGSLGRIIDDMVGRMCDVDGGLGTTRAAAVAARGPWFRQGIIGRGRMSNARAFALAFGDDLLRVGIYVANAETVQEVEIFDGRVLLDEILCDPSIILDGIRLGEAFRRLLRFAGYNDAEISLVPSDFGPMLPKARPGEGWATVIDDSQSVGAAIEGLLDRWGLGLRFYQNANGVFVLETIPSAVVATFTSEGASNDPDLLRGSSRFIILRGCNWERDHENYFNIFRVVGGPDDKPISREWFDSSSMRRQGGGGVSLQPRYLGRAKRYPTLRDSGLRTLGDVIYAYRSLADRYGRPGRKATFKTYFVGQFQYRDRVRCDGVLCEVLRWEASALRDRMQIQVQEVA